MSVAASLLHEEQPPSSAPARNEYAELKRLVERNGLLRPRPGYYIGKIVANAIVLVLGLVGLRLAGLGAGWWLADVILLSFAFVQVALLGHDVAHFQFLRAGKLNTTLGLILGNLLVGVSRAWWNDNHSAHHARPNDVGSDPNVNILFLACSPEQGRSRPRWVQWVVRHQVALLIPIFALEFFSMHQQSLDYAIRRRPGCARAELWLIIAHYAAYFCILVIALGLPGALAFALVHHALTGVYMAMIFAPNHKGMPLASPRAAGGFLREQVLTSRNVHGNWFVDLAFGGLNYQIEHHLFPSMPRNNLSRVRPTVRAYCESLGVAYCETSLSASWREIVGHFGGVSRALNSRASAENA